MVLVNEGSCSVQLHFRVKRGQCPKVRVVVWLCPRPFYFLFSVLRSNASKVGMSSLQTFNSLLCNFQDEKAATNCVQTSKRDSQDQ